MLKSVFHPKFTTFHRPTVASAGLGLVTVSRVIERGSYNLETGLVDGDLTDLLYQGRARVQKVGRPTNRDFMEDTARFQTTRVQLDWNDNKLHNVDFDGWAINDVVKITTNESDPFSEGTDFYVHGFLSSTNSWLTTLVCQTNMKQGNG